MTCREKDPEPDPTDPLSDADRLAVIEAISGLSWTWNTASGGGSYPTVSLREVLRIVVNTRATPTRKGRS